VPATDPFKQAVNDAIYTLAEVGDFPELFVRDETTATTVAETKSYHLVDDLGLTRPKSIFNILLIDNGNSRKLIPQTPAEMDLRSPYPENSTSGVPSYYALVDKNFLFVSWSIFSRLLYVKNIWATRYRRWII